MPQYRITIYTGNADYAGTNANVFITIYGDVTNSGEKHLDNDDDNFEQGKTDIFTLELPQLGNLTSVRIRHDDTGFASGWFLDKIIVRNEESGKEWLFPCNNWLASDEGDLKTERVLYPAA